MCHVWKWEWFFKDMFLLTVVGSFVKAICQCGRSGMPCSLSFARRVHYQRSHPDWWGFYTVCMMLDWFICSGPKFKLYPSWIARRDTTNELPASTEQGRARRVNWRLEPDHWEHSVMPEKVRTPGRRAASRDPPD